MRLWSLHPRYLDPKGLVALWRESLLGQRVLQGLTRGYVNHPQLDRFRRCPDPAGAIAAYLWSIEEEASARGYNFDKTKIAKAKGRHYLTVTDAQIHHERLHLLDKLKKRSPFFFNKLNSVKSPDANPVFTVIHGKVENWERVSNHNSFK